MNDYPTLQADIGLWLMRDDLTAFIPSFIRLGEAVIGPEVRHWKMLTRAVATGNNTRFLQLPPRFVEMKRFRNTSVENSNPFESVAPDRLDIINTSTHSTQYAVHEELEFDKAPASTDQLEMLYYAYPITLTDATPNNPLLVYAYDLYLYAALAESAPFIQDDERIPVWSGRYGKARDALNAEEDRHGTSGGTRKVVLARRTHLP